MIGWPYGRMASPRVPTPREYLGSCHGLGLGIIPRMDSVSPACGTHAGGKRPSPCNGFVVFVQTEYSVALAKCFLEPALLYTVTRMPDSSASRLATSHGTVPTSVVAFAAESAPEGTQNVPIRDQERPEGKLFIRELMDDEESEPGISASGIDVLSLIHI